jgi:hypothetical protein
MKFSPQRRKDAKGAQRKTGTEFEMKIANGLTLFDKFDRSRADIFDLAFLCAPFAFLAPLR